MIASTPTVAGFLALTTFHSVSSLISLYSLVFRSKKYPFNGREMSLVWILWFAFTHDIFFVILTTIFPPAPCVYVVMTGAFLILAYMNASVLRLFRLWFMYFHAHEVLDGRHGASKSKWFESHRHWVSRKSLMRTFFTCNTVMCAVVYATYFGTGEYEPGSVGTGVRNCGVSNAFNALLAFQITVTCGVVFTAYKIRNVQDGYFIKDEFKYLAIVGIVITILTPIYALEHGPGFPYFRFCFVLVMEVFIGVLFHFPLYKSLAFEYKERQMASQLELTFQRASLLEILTNEAYAEKKRDFALHLVSEFSLENLLFWERSTKFLTIDLGGTKSSHSTCARDCHASLRAPLVSQRNDASRCSSDVLTQLSPADYNEPTSSHLSPKLCFIDTTSTKHTAVTQVDPAEDSSQNGHNLVNLTPQTLPEIDVVVDTDRDAKLKQSPALFSSLRAESHNQKHNSKTESVCDECSINGDENDFSGAQVDDIWIAREAMDIYRTFVQCDAAQEANLSATHRTQIYDDLHDVIANFQEVLTNSEGNTRIHFTPGKFVEATVFENARAEVYRIMSQDPFLRWQKRQESLRLRLASRKKIQPDTSTSKGSAQASAVHV